MWLWLIIIAIIIGSIWGFFSSKNGERKIGALSGGCVGGIGCASLLFYLLTIGGTIMLILWLCQVIFG